MKTTSKTKETLETGCWGRYRQQD